MKSSQDHNKKNLSQFFTMVRENALNFILNESLEVQSMEIQKYIQVN